MLDTLPELDRVDLIPPFDVLQPYLVLSLRVSFLFILPEKGHLCYCTLINAYQIHNVRQFVFHCDICRHVLGLCRVAICRLVLPFVVVFVNYSSSLVIFSN